jgi:histidine triad (HIT) family protein
MPAETIFSKIIRREIPSDIIYQDAQVTAFRDINPQAPVHILIVPNKLIPTANDVMPEDEQLIGHMFVVARTIAAQEGIAENGYRLMVNCNRDGGQEVYHLHIHLLGGRRPLGPMLKSAPELQRKHLCAQLAAVYRASTPSLK